MPSTTSLTACQADRNCPWCNLTHGGGPSLPNDPGEPIHPGSGDVTVTQPLFSIAQDPMPLSFGLEYHSELAGNQQLINEPMGRGWTHNFNQSLRAVGTFDNDLYMLHSDGSEAWYRQTGATTWTSQTPGDLRETIALVNGQMQVKDLDGRVTAFDAASGVWSSTTDRWGNTISGTYNTSGQLASIIDIEGRSVQLTYTGTLLTQITLPDGQAWRFAYAGGELARIFDPMHTASTPWHVRIRRRHARHRPSSDRRARRSGHPARRPRVRLARTRRHAPGPSPTHLPSRSPPKPSLVAVMSLEPGVRRQAMECRRPIVAVSPSN